MSTNQSSFNLHGDLLKQILLLLPLESIPVCKLVSNEWKNLIDDPDFFKHCRDTSVALFDFHNIVYCVLVKEATNTIKGHCNPPFTVNRIPIDLNSDSIVLLLSEPSKGIACVISNSGQLFLYNLFTGASYTITDHAFIDRVCYGIGYDVRDDDCKIFWRSKEMASCKYKACDDDGLLWVYSLRNRKWESFRGFPSERYGWLSISHLQGCSFNGALHWVGRFTHSILTCDLHTYEFGEMLLPIACNFHVVRVVELGGQLCCWTRGPPFRIWAMRKYGVSESWEMLLTTDNEILTKSRWRMPMMLYECRDGRKFVLFSCQPYGSLGWYDIDNDKMKIITKSAWEKIRRTPKRKTGV